jgi:peptide/nickel transport system substrate-binding protein
MSHRSRLLCSAAAIVAASVVVVGATSPIAADATASRAGWTISIASPTWQMPSWAYPYASGDVLTEANVERFQQLMYRPLYSFVGSSTVDVNPALSLATAPTYQKGDTVVSFAVKPGLRFSDGQQVSARGVVEWLNLLASFPSMWGDYLAPLPDGPALGLPDDLQQVAVAGNQVTLTLNGPVNPTWFTYSQLSQLTPLPASWDRYEPSRPHVPIAGPASITANHGDYTAAVSDAGCYGTHWVGAGNHGPTTTFLDPQGQRTVVSAANVAQAQRCVSVVQLMRSMSADTKDYTVVGTDVAADFDVSDGPWRLLGYHPTTGAITMAPNLAVGASGQRPTASLLSFVPCASAAACTALLTSGTVDQGTLPLATAPSTPSLAAAPAHNPLARHGYRETVVAPWATSYFPYNFQSRLGAGGRAGRVFQQRYVRQAFQSLVDQTMVVNRFLHGYGVVTTGPVPAVPVTGFASAVTNPSPFGIARAAAILSRHGWHVVANGTTTCAVPERCGPGIAKGTPLSFRVLYAPTSPALAASMHVLKADAAKAGVTLTLQAASAAAVLAQVTGGSTSWDLASWDGGWRYAPDYFPSGEWTFAAGAAWNVGGFADPHATSLVEATMRAPQKLAAYDRYLAIQLPVVWQPTPVTLLETRASLRGVVVSPLGSLTPEAWRRG